MKWFKNIFRRKPKQDPQPLRIEGMPPAPMTAEPDDAELAAQALLDIMSGHGDGKADEGKAPEPEKGTAEYYRVISERIRHAHEDARLRALRFVSFVEQELLRKDLPLTGKGSLAMLNAELLKRVDTVYREGGELKKRWQHCLAEVTVRLTQATSHTEDKQDLSTP